MEDTDKGKEILYGCIQEESEMLDHIVDIVKSMYINVLEKHKPEILVHPFSTLMRCDFTHKSLLDIFDSVCEVCQETGTSIEINKSQIDDSVINPAPVLIDHPDVPPKDVFYDQMIKISQKYDITYSLGSDAHRLRDVGDIKPCVEIIRDYQINPKKVLNLVEEGKNPFI